MIKKIANFLLMIILLLSLSSCSSNDLDDLYHLINQHKMLKNNITDLTYEEVHDFADKTYVQPEFFVKDSDVILMKGNLVLTIGDLKGLTDTQKVGYQRIVEDLSGLKGLFIDFKEESKLSKIYDDKEHGWKYIFEQTVISYNDTVRNRRVYINTRYRFKQVDGKWKILAIEETQRQYLEDRDKEQDEEKMVEEMGFDTFNNEPVEYVKILE